MLIFSRHFKEMLIQRNIEENWVHRTVDQPDRVDRHDEGAKRLWKETTDG